MPTEIWRDEVCQMVAGGAALVEVLPAEEYEAEHLPGAINIPLPQLDRHSHRSAPAGPTGHCLLLRLAVRPQPPGRGTARKLGLHAGL